MNLISLFIINIISFTFIFGQTERFLPYLRIIYTDKYVKTFTYYFLFINKVFSGNFGHRVCIYYFVFILMNVSGLVVPTANKLISFSNLNSIGECATSDRILIVSV